MNISGSSKWEQNIAQIPKIAAVKEEKQKQGNSCAFALCFLSPTFFLSSFGRRTKSNLCSWPGNALLIWRRAPCRDLQPHMTSDTFWGFSRDLTWIITLNQGCPHLFILHRVSSSVGSDKRGIVLRKPGVFSGSAAGLMISGGHPCPPSPAMKAPTAQGGK